MAENTPRMQWPYPAFETDPWYENFVSFVNAMDASSYASREDRQMLMAEGGTISWDLASNTFTFTQPFILTAPITGFLWQVTAGSFVLLEGQSLYATLNRSPGSNTSLTATASGTIPSSDNTAILAVRVNNRVYLRTGLVLSDGNSIIGGAAPEASTTFSEQDGTPTISATSLKVPNYSLTDEGGGVASLKFPLRISQAFSADVTGTTYINVGSVYLTAGTLLAPARIFAGATTAPPDQAIVELRRETDSFLVATWTVTGTLAEATQGTNVNIPANDWYNVRLAGSDVAVVAQLRGVDWTIIE